MEFDLSWILLGLPLAFVALPLYVHLPHLYASRYGMSLASLGAVLLLSRVFDALCDPLLGHWSDHLAVHSPQRLRWGTRVVDAPGLDTTHTAGTGAALGVSSGP